MYKEFYLVLLIGEKNRKKEERKVEQISLLKYFSLKL